MDIHKVLVEDDEHQSLIYAHERMIHAQDKQIQQQAAKIEEQAAMVEEQVAAIKRQDEKWTKLEVTLKRLIPTIDELDADADSNDRRNKQNLTYDLGAKIIQSNSRNRHEKCTDNYVKELKISMINQEDRMEAMEAAHQTEIAKLNLAMQSLQSFTEQNVTNETHQIEECVSQSSDDDNFIIHPGTTNTSSNTAPSHLRTVARRAVSSSFLTFIGRSQGDSSSLEFILEEDTYSLMMIAKPCSQEWLLGLITFIIFQFGLEAMILYDLVMNVVDDMFMLDHFGTRSILFNVPIFAPPQVTVAQGIVVILVLATQSDVLTSVHTLVTLRKNAGAVAWDKLVGDEGNRSWCLWITRVLIPNLAKFVQGVIILFVSFLLIVQSRDVIDLLKDFTSLLVVSQADNIIFYIADVGYLGEHLAMRAREVKNRRIELGPTVGNVGCDEGEESNGISRKFARCSICNAFKFRSVIFFVMCCTMIRGWWWVVHGQYSGDFLHQKYPLCKVTIPDIVYLGDGICDDYVWAEFNTEECGWDDGDCPAKELVEAFPGCSVPEPFLIGNGFCDANYPYFTEGCDWDGGDCKVEGYQECHVTHPTYIGNGICNDYAPFNTPECGYDGSDCPIPQEVEGLPDCFVSYPEKLGDKDCHWELPYNSPECNRDGGDCKQVEGYPDCYVPEPSWIGNGNCDDSLVYNNADCGYDGGDCQVPREILKLPGCLVSDPSKLGDGECNWRLPYQSSYNSPECNRDFGDCVVKGYPDCNVPDPSYIGNGECNNYPPYNTTECGYDGGDCGSS